MEKKNVKTIIIIEWEDESGKINLDYHAAGYKDGADSYETLRTVVKQLKESANEQRKP